MVDPPAPLSLITAGSVTATAQPPARRTAAGSRSETRAAGRTGSVSVSGESRGRFRRFQVVTSPGIGASGAKPAGPQSYSPSPCRRAGRAPPPRPQLVDLNIHRRRPPHYAQPARPDRRARAHSRAGARFDPRSSDARSARLNRPRQRQERTRTRPSESGTRVGPAAPAGPARRVLRRRVCPHPAAAAVTAGARSPGSLRSARAAAAVSRRAGSSAGIPCAAAFTPGPCPPPRLRPQQEGGGMRRQGAQQGRVDRRDGWQGGAAGEGRGQNGNRGPRVRGLRRCAVAAQPSAARARGSRPRSRPRFGGAVLEAAATRGLKPPRVARSGRGLGMYAFGSHGSESRGGRAVRGTIAVFSDAEKPAFVRMHGRRSWPFLAAAEKETTAGAHHLTRNFVIG